jgi:hypothetical protein
MMRGQRPLLSPLLALALRFGHEVVEDAALLPVLVAPPGYSFLA